MARMPGAVWLGEHSPERPMDRYDIICAHTIVGFAPAHAAHFSTKADGTILQSRDTMFRSGANLDGNHRIIAIENEDHGPAFGDWNTSDGHAVPALTAAQVEANAAILRWAHEEHGVPLELCPDSRPTSRGLAYHRQGIPGNFLQEGYAFPGIVPGGEVWTTSPGKVCPGDRRIAQLPDILRIAEEGDNMPLTAEDKLWIAAALDARLEAFGKQAGELIKVDHDGDPDTPKLSLERRLRAIDAALVAMVADVDDLVAAGVKAGLADAVIDVNVNIGTKETP